MARLSIRLPSSPRRRRRLGWGVVLLAVGGALAGVIALAQNGAPDSREVFRAGKPVDVTVQKPVPLTPAARWGIGSTLDRFVRDGVARRNLPAAYDLVTPNFRGGMTRSEWRKGSPIYPYPDADPRGRPSKDWSLDFSYRRDVAVDLMLASRHPRRIGSVIFKLELLERHGRWLVDSFAPVATFSPIGGPLKETGPADYTGAAAVNGTHVEKARLSAVWFVVPGGVLGLAFLMLLGFAVTARIRSRRSDRGYEALPKTLPPLPSSRS
jgi:hypothetical protein